jgi:hypothetical protein
MGTRLGGWRSGALAAAVAMIVLGGCSPTPTAGPPPPGAAGPASFWTRSRLLDAQPLRGGRELVPAPGQTPDSHTAQLAPFGIWTPERLLVAPQWAKSADPDLDVGFVVLAPHDGQNIEQVLGASQLATDSGYRYLVRVTGYPAGGNAPITCLNWTSRRSATQLRFNCDGYTGGTSGSPWVTHFSTRSRTGTIVGVIGGYQQGGDTPSISYSAFLGSGVHQLYEQAVADGTASSQG